MYSRGISCDFEVRLTCFAPSANSFSTSFFALSFFVHFPPSSLLRKDFKITSKSYENRVIFVTRAHRHVAIPYLEGDLPPFCCVAFYMKLSFGAWLPLLSVCRWPWVFQDEALWWSHVILLTFVLQLHFWNSYEFYIFSKVEIYQHIKLFTGVLLHHGLTCQKSIRGTVCVKVFTSALLTQATVYTVCLCVFDILFNLKKAICSFNVWWNWMIS